MRLKRKIEPFSKLFTVRVTEEMFDEFTKKCEKEQVSKNEKLREIILKEIRK